MKYTIVAIFDFFISLIILPITLVSLIYTFPRILPIYSTIYGNNLPIGGLIFGLLCGTSVLVIGGFDIFYGVKEFSKNEAVKQRYHQRAIIFPLASFIPATMLIGIMMSNLINPLYHIASQ